MKKTMRFGPVFMLVMCFAFAVGGPIEDNEIFSKNSEAASCLVDEIIYMHGTQIQREDSCDYCLCVDGEMFCYWQCITTLSSSVTSTEITATSHTSALTTEQNATFTPESTTHETNSSSLPPATTMMLNVSNVETSTISTITTITTTTTTATTNITDGNATLPAINETCVEKGVEYEVGEKLPRDDVDEDTCLECVCAAGGRVTCIPSHCATLNEDEIGRDAGQASNTLDMFDVDAF